MVERYGILTQYLIQDMPDGVDYFFWECYAAVPVDAPAYPEPMHSPRYRAEMDRRRRVSNNAAKHEHRARAEATIEQFDPQVLHPDAMSASLDHVVPLSKGGDHTRSDSVLAQLICNIQMAAS